MEDYEPLEFLQLCEEFVLSSIELRDAAALCEGDTIKQDMVAFIIPEFDYLENREFVADEIRTLTRENRKIAKLIRDKLNKLAWS